MQAAREAVLGVLACAALPASAIAILWLLRGGRTGDHRDG